MKYINKFNKTSEFESAKEQLNTLKHYVAYDAESKTIYLKEEEKPDMADIALYDNTTDSIVTIHGYDYNAASYPTDRYTPIGVVVIPKEHMDDGKSRIISLNYMRYDTPKVGGDKQKLYWGLGNSADIEGFEHKSYVPHINQSGTTEFGNTKQISEMKIGKMVKQ